MSDKVNNAINNETIWHTLGFEDCLDRLKADVEGLSEQDVSQPRKKFGPDRAALAQPSDGPSETPSLPSSVVLDQQEADSGGDGCGSEFPQ